jgi:hypothetical protein
MEVAVVVDVEEEVGIESPVVEIRGRVEETCQLPDKPAVVVVVVVVVAIIVVKEERINGIGDKPLQNLLPDEVVVDEVEVVVDVGVEVITMMVRPCMMVRLRPWRGETIVGNHKRIRPP